MCDRYLARDTYRRVTRKAQVVGPIECYLRPYFGHRQLQAMQCEHIEDFRKALKADVLPRPIRDARAQRILGSRSNRRELRPGNANINKALRILHAMLEYAIELGWVKYNAARRIGKLATKKVNSILSIEEVVRVISELEGPPRDEDDDLRVRSPNWDLIIRLAIYTGTRQGEILGLQWGDLHVANNQLTSSARGRIAVTTRQKKLNWDEGGSMSHRI